MFIVDVARPSRLSNVRNFSAGHLKESHIKSNATFLLGKPVTAVIMVLLFRYIRN